MSTRVSVLMPVAEPAPFLAEALRSVVAQSMDAWELVLVNDGASARVEAEARRIVPEDRLKVVNVAVRKGLSYALNEGLRAAQGDLVARLDSDDRAFSDRLERQLLYMDSHPNVAMVGTSARLIDEFGFARGIRTVADGRANEALIRRNQFIHSSVTFRRELVRNLGGYSEDCHLREDYELWLRVAAHAQVANLADPGVDYRVSENQVSRRVPSKRALRQVSHARRQLARATGMRPLQSSALDLAWRFAQRGIGRRMLASRRLRQARSEGVNTTGNWREASMPEFHEHLIEALATIDRIARGLDCPYTLVAGSALGAHRSGGLIPWDDDVDLAMTAEGFDRFTKLAPPLLGPQLTLHTRREDPVLGANAKLYIDGTMLDAPFGQQHGFQPPRHSGAFVDVFVLYRASTYPWLRWTEMALGWCIYVRPWASRMVSARITMPLRTRLAYAICATLPRAALGFVERQLWKWSERRQSYFWGIGIGGVNGSGLYRPESVFPPRRAEFEGTGTFVPRDAQTFLRSTYGPNFMTPTPLAQRSAHGRVLLRTSEES